MNVSGEPSRRVPPFSRSARRLGAIVAAGTIAVAGLLRAQPAAVPAGAPTPEQKSALNALDAAIARFASDLERMTDLGQRARSESLLDVFKERRSAMHQQRFDQVRYDELRFDLNVEYQRLGQFLAKSSPPRTHSQVHRPARHEVPELRLVMLPMAAGTFVMGRPEGTAGSSPDESPETRVVFAKPFWIAATEVTRGQWRRFTAATGHRTEPEESIGQNPGSESAADWPMAKVSWHDAQAFCAWLTRREHAGGRLPAGYVYSLPTEAQWEYACRAGNRGPDPEKLDEWAWHAGTSGGAPHAVGTKRPNLWGLFDLQGNVAEWCLDRGGPYPGGTVTDPQGPPEGESRRTRGGSAWSAAGGDMSSTSRGTASAEIRRNDLGFRVALTPAR